MNDSFARYFFGSGSPLGRTVTSRQVAYEIVGVVKDAKYTNLRQEMMPTLYLAWTQREGEEPTDFNFLARVTGGRSDASDAHAGETGSRGGPRFTCGLREGVFVGCGWHIVTERIMATLGSFFGLLALIVACLGIFGVMAFQVSRRMNEIGLRDGAGGEPGRDRPRRLCAHVAAMLVLGWVHRRGGGAECDGPRPGDALRGPAR